MKGNDEVVQVLQDVLCAELCGVGHAFMRGAVLVDSEADYLAWLGQQSTFAMLSQPTRVGAAEPLE